MSLKRRYSYPSFYVVWYQEDGWKCAGFYTGFSSEDAIRKANEDQIGGPPDIKMRAVKIKMPGPITLLKAHRPKGRMH